jgi:hypothetical protein
MADEPPSGGKVVYVFLEMIALGFVLEAVSAFMRGDVWWKSSGALVMGILFFVAGVKSEQIKLKVSPRFAHYLNQRQVWMVVFVLFSGYVLQNHVVLGFVMNLHQRWQGWLGYAVFGLSGAILLSGYWWLTGRLLRAPSVQPASTVHPKLTGQDDRPPTLLDLFKNEFSNTFRSSDQEDAISINWNDGAITKIKRQVYMDFPAKTKFVGFFISSPVPPSADLSGNKTFTACLSLLQNNSVQEAFDHVSKSIAVLAGQGGQMTSIQDLTFSGRVLIYHEEFLSIPQKAEILKAYASKNLDVQFRGNDHLGPQVIDWHRKHEPTTPH